MKNLKRKKEEDHHTFQHETRDDWVQFLLDATPLCEDALHMTLDFVWPRKPMAEIIKRESLTSHLIDLTIDPKQGNLYLLGANHLSFPSKVKITVYSGEDFNTQIACWGKVGTDVQSGQFNRPTSIAFCAASRQVLVLDSTLHAVHIFTPMGIFVRSFRLHDLHDDPFRGILTQLIVSPQTHELYFEQDVGVWRYSLEGKCFEEHAWNHPFRVHNHLDMAFAADGTLYQCNQTHMTVYNPERKEVAEYDCPNFGVLAVHDDGTLWAWFEENVQGANNRLRLGRFSSTGDTCLQVVKEHFSLNASFSATLFHGQLYVCISNSDSSRLVVIV